METWAVTASEDAKVWIEKDAMDRFHIFIAVFFFFLFKLLSIIFLRQEMQLVFVSTMASVLRFLLCRRNVLPSCLEFQSGYGFSMKYITSVILAGYKQEWKWGWDCFIQFLLTEGVLWVTLMGAIWVNEVKFSSFSCPGRRVIVKGKSSH